MDEKLQAVLKYAGNDQERAKKIMSGDLKDIRVVNGSFAIPAVDIYSQFQMFFSIENEDLMNISLVLFNDPELYEKINIEESWKLFHTKLKQNMETDTVQDSTDIMSHLAESIEGYQMIFDVQDKDAESVQLTINEIVQKSYSVNEVTSTVYMSDISTLDMVENNIPIGKIPKKKSEVKTEGVSAEEKSELENQAQFTVDSSLLISPVSGKYIQEIIPGDLLKVVMNSKNEVTEKIAKALNALDEDGNFKPVKGRVKEITPLSGGGYRIYCLIAKGILARIIEEENIKAELFIPEDNKQADKSKQKSTQVRLLVYGAAFVFVLIFAVILIMMIV